MKDIVFPENFLFGSATAATQIEGGDENSNWYHWSVKGKIAEGGSSIIASDHVNRFREDIDLMKEMGHQVYRMSIEWSRIEPEEGVWSQQGIAYYRDEITYLKECGIEPLVTLHHFSHPQWFEEKGAWASQGAADLFLRFVEKVIDTLGDIIEEYCTINEPNVFLNSTYMEGDFPPGCTGETGKYFKGADNLIQAHIRSYKLIHSKRKAMGFKNTKVGFAHHMACIEAHGRNPITKISRNILDYSFHALFLKGMIEGYFSFPLRGGYRFGKGVYCDFIGINYYSRHLIHPSWNPAMFFGEIRVDSKITEDNLNDMGWEIYPEGLYKVCSKVYEKYKMPIYITENGIPDRDDSKRAQFILEHLIQVNRLIKDGVDVRRYYYWSLMDNLEWHEGFGPRFGLIHVDYKTLQRTKRESASFYSSICREKKITDEIIEKSGGVLWKN